jgi:hypothetical protein
VPERIYLNRRAGEERIHVELTEAEIADILDDFPKPGSDAFEATKDLHRILRAASKVFAGDRRHRTES